MDRRSRLTGEVPSPCDAVCRPENGGALGAVPGKDNRGFPTLTPMQEHTAHSPQDFHTIETVLADTLDRLMDASQSTAGVVTGVPTGLEGFDQLTSGLRCGELVVVAGHPGAGKTALAAGIALHVASTEGLPVALFSVESDAMQLGERLVSSLGCVDIDHIHTGRLADNEWQQVSDAMAKLRHAPLYLEDSAVLTVEELAAKAHRLAAQCGRLGLVIVDYIQLLATGENPSVGRDEIAKRLKLLARELQCPVLALSDLRHCPEESARRRPGWIDLCDAYALPRYADLVAFLHRQACDAHAGNARSTAAELIVARQRFGPAGTVHLRFLAHLSRFVGLASAAPTM